jgi:3alpha(or 20beta)-hydroxysteroid dehydrogenase
MADSSSGVLAGRTALITGSARGQGAAEARLFVAEGANVVISDVRSELGSELAAELGEQAAYIDLDVGDPDAWGRGAALAVDRFGGLDILVNNAALAQGMASIEEQSLEDYMTIVRVNQVGVWLGIKTVAPHLRRAGGGSIINIASVGGCIGVADQAAYVATKWAVRGMTRSAALELAADAIRVNAIVPGAVDTDMPAEAGVQNVADVIGPTVPLGRIADSIDIAQLALFLASDASSFCTGADFAVDGGTMAGSIRLRAAAHES